MQVAEGLVLFSALAPNLLRGNNLFNLPTPFSSLIAGSSLVIHGMKRVK